MNKLEIYVTELDGKVEGAMSIGVKSVAKLELPRSMCVQFFKTAIEGLEHTDEDVFMDALELYLKEKSGE